MKEKVLFEVCCGCFEDAVQAEKGGADRIEPVSYTHLDVYKRQPLSFGLYNFEDECILRRFHSKIKRNNAQTNVYLYVYTCLLYTSRCV